MKHIHVIILLLCSQLCSAQSIQLNKEQVNLKWFASKIGGKYSGAISVRSANLVLKNDTITNGKFVIDMATLANTSIKSTKNRAKMTKHLKSSDFFDVAVYPTANFSFSEEVIFRNDTASAAGVLKIKDVSNIIQVEIIREGKHYRSKLTLSRTEYGIKYGAGSFFGGLGDKVISDEFTVEIDIELN